MQIVEAPNSLKPYLSSSIIKVYITGSISLDKSKKNWIEIFIDRLAKSLKNRDIFIFHPIRKDWKSDWGKDRNDSQFWEQITWELEAQELADIVVMHFEPDALAPITLMEFGLNARPKAIGYSRLIVHCPKEFWKKGNVDIVCAKYGIKHVETLNALVDVTIKQIELLKRKI